MLIGLFFAANSMATNWSGPRKIVAIETLSTKTEIRLEGQADVQACTKITENGVPLTWGSIPADAPNANAFLSIVLMAYSTGKKVNIYCDNAAPWSQINHIKIEDF